MIHDYIAVLENMIINETSLTDIIKVNKKLNNFKYGLVINGVYDSTRNTTAKDWDRYYRLQSPNEFLKRKVGVCWDYVTAEAYIFSKQFPDIIFSTYYIEFDDNDEFPTHTFLIFEYQNQYYLFESSFKKICGIYQACSKEDIINMVMFYMDKYGKPLLNLNYKLYKYDALDTRLYNSSTYTYMQYMQYGKLINHKYNPIFHTKKIN